MASKMSRVFISIVGRPATGKTTIMKLILEILKKYGIEAKPDWGIEGEPQTSPEFDLKRISAVAAKTLVVVHQIQARRIKASEEFVEDVSIQVLHDKDKGFGVRLTVGGFPLESWFGEFALSKERARTVAARLSAEFDLEVQDNIPREYEWVQPQ